MQKILIQLDTDSLPSSFDRVVAVDADVDHLFSYGSVSPDNVEPLVHGAMFTRGPKDLQNTAIFIGGSQVAAGEELQKRVLSTFFGPVRVSVMMDSNGSNTTAAAAVASAGQHVTLSETKSLVLGGTGPVGQRAAQLLAAEGSAVHVVSRTLERAEECCKAIIAAVPEARLTPLAMSDAAAFQSTLWETELIIAAGAARVQFLTAEQLQGLSKLKVAIDLNAVPPVGLGGIEVMDKEVNRNGVVCYGAIGVGGTKMKIHKAAIRKLFEKRDHILDTAAIYEIAKDVLA